MTNGYDYDDPVFRQAAEKVLETRKADEEQAEQFLRQMEKSLRQLANK